MSTLSARCWEIIREFKFENYYVLAISMAKKNLRNVNFWEKIQFRILKSFISLFKKITFQPWGNKKMVFIIYN